MEPKCLIVNKDVVFERVAEIQGVVEDLLGKAYIVWDVSERPDRILI